ncbi:hypothetical protein NP233_g12748 [Leucocoprinus birnbaumii]|uniref:Uncharacterized protein n=1 Tax=Leucocoprinus birnbaumii TaxID=56174 RepID=A0AAD5YPQ1_9AGAR|nr:hypothetical protein NP233_g12748 [Leucocoprinus birnbaumii]
MVFDSFIDSLRAWTSRFWSRSQGKGIKARGSAGQWTWTSESTPPPGFFANAHHVVMQQPEFTNVQNSNNTYNLITSGNTGAPLHPPREPMAAGTADIRLNPQTTIAMG